MTLFPFHEVGLERKLAITLGFMFVIPTLLVVWAMVYTVDLRLLVYLIVGSAFIGYIVVRRMVQSMLRLTEKARKLSSGQARGTIDIEERNEIGELARSFNRITRELEHKIGELESSRDLVKRLLSRIGTAINSYEGIDNLLDLIVENTTAALEAEMGSLMLVDGEKRELYLTSAWTKDGPMVHNDRRVKLGEGILGWVAKEGHAMRGTGNRTTLGFPGDGYEGTEGVILCVPLKLRDQPMGVVSVLRNDASRAFTEDDEMLLASIGSQMAVAIENYRLNLDVERTYLETIMALALAVEAKDPYSAGHSKRAGFYATKIGEALGLDQEMLRTLNDAGVLHDIGKIGIKDEILLKTTPLTPDEQKMMQQHPIIGEAIVKPVRSLSKVVTLVRCHHELFDGSGYPGGLKGEEIPLGARILTVADTYDSMITDRPYRKRLSVEEARAELSRHAGTRFDPVVVGALLRFLDEKAQRLAAGTDADQPA